MKRTQPVLGSGEKGEIDMSHTPGPWSVDQVDEAAYVFDRENIPICHVAGSSNLQLVAGNGRLIAAAPRMLECIQNVEANLSGPDHFVERVADSLRRCRAVLREIEGEDTDA